MNEQYRVLLDSVLALAPGDPVPEEIKERLYVELRSNPDSARHFAELGRFLVLLIADDTADVPEAACQRIRDWIDVQLRQ